MLEVSISDLLLVYLGSMLAMVGLAWLGRHLWRSRTLRKEDDCRVRCLACGDTYQAPGPAELPPCPSCGRSNERAR